MLPLQVAKFIKKRGRLSLADLAAESNKLINLSQAVTPETQAAGAGGGS